MRGRLTGIGCLAVLGALAWPAISADEIDSLPLSNYPMFAHPRPEVTTFQLAVFVDDAGTERRLDPTDISGTDQPMQAVATLRRAIRTHTAAELCDEIAARVPGSGTVRVATARYDAIGWFRGAREPLDVEVHAACRSEASG